MMAKTTVKTETDPKDEAMRKPSRPYTDYNIFFQLEREHVLQVDLGVKQNFDAGVFDPNNCEYHGPPLPSRYSGLVLPDDWHVPGKVVRRKRIHRKSHGVIGFHDLSNRISTAWKSVDEETKDFCEKLSDIGVLQYKAAMRKYRVSNPDDESPVKAKPKAKAPRKTKPKVKKASPARPIITPTVSDLSEDYGNSTVGPDGNMKRDATVDLLEGLNDDLFTSVMCGDNNVQASAYCGEVNQPLPCFNSLFGAPEKQGPNGNHCVDMPDNEILGMWDFDSMPKREMYQREMNQHEMYQREMMQRERVQRERMQYERMQREREMTHAQMTRSLPKHEGQVDTSSSGVPMLCVFIPKEEPPSYQEQQQQDPYMNSTFFCRPVDEHLSSRSSLQY